MDTLRELLIDELSDLYSAENQLVKALPKMAKAAFSAELRTALEDHLAETEGQVSRLDQIFSELGEKPKRKKCKAMEGLIEEGAEVIEAKGSAEVKDVALIGAAQRVEHYEMAAYGTTRAIAETLSLNNIAELLQETLDEEGQADKKLNDLATSGINEEALTAKPRKRLKHANAKPAFACFFSYVVSLCRSFKKTWVASETLVTSAFEASKSED